jgi:hypothetical protein
VPVTGLLLPSGYCHRPAEAVAYFRYGGSILIRTDHLTPPREGSIVADRVVDARCLDCLFNQDRGTPDPIR